MACAYCCLEGFLQAAELDRESTIRVIILFDSEEIGSCSLMGAESTLLGDVLRGLEPNPDMEQIARRKSLILSCVVVSCYR